MPSWADAACPRDANRCAARRSRSSRGLTRRTRSRPRNGGGSSSSSRAGSGARAAHLRQDLARERPYLLEIVREAHAEVEDEEVAAELLVAPHAVDDVIRCPGEDRAVQLLDLGELAGRRLEPELLRVRILDQAGDVEPIDSGLRRRVDARHGYGAGHDHRLALLVGHLTDLLDARGIRRERDPAREPALAEIDGEPRGGRRRAAPPDRHG